MRTWWRKPSAPKAILLASKLMFAGAGASAALGIAQIAYAHTYWVYLRRGKDAQAAADWGTNSSGLAYFFIFYMILSMALWIWLSCATRAGKRWVKPVTTLLWAVSTLLSMGIVGGSVEAPVVVAAVLSAIVWAIGSYTVMQLHKPESGRYFRSPRN